MIKIKYEIYDNDYNRRYEDKSFGTMAEFKDWMFGLMNRPYVDSDGHKNMWFLDSVLDSPGRLDSSCRITIRPEWGGASYWVYCVNDNNKVVFSNGKYTNGQCYISDGFKAFLKECQDRRDGKEQTFVFGEIDGYSPVPEKTVVEQAAEIVKSNPALAREISWIVDREHHREDILSQIEQKELDIELTDVDVDEITSRFDKALSRNEGYYECYWLTAQYVIDDYLKEKAGPLKSAPDNAMEYRADTGNHRENATIDSGVQPIYKHYFVLYKQQDRDVSVEILDVYEDREKARPAEEEAMRKSGYFETVFLAEVLMLTEEIALDNLGSASMGNNAQKAYFVLYKQDDNNGSVEILDVFENREQAKQAEEKAVDESSWHEVVYLEEVYMQEQEVALEDKLLGATERSCAPQRESEKHQEERELG